MQCPTNHEHANFIISSLLKLGVDTFCIGSGSRSAPIAKALELSLTAKTVHHYDERSLGFFALGVAKASNAPTCVVTTSGSAVANLFPAVMEAYMDGVPLIVLTCDRPYEDQDRGMNQTCDQANIFGSYVKHSKNFPSAPHNFPLSAISSSLSYLVAESIFYKSPVHLNISFNEPLLDKDSSSVEKASLVNHLPSIKRPSNEAVDYLVDMISSHKNGIIIAGGCYEEGYAEAVLSLSEKLQFPLLADPLSNIRTLGRSSTAITHYNQILHHTQNNDSLKPDLILFFGGHVISKNVLLWTKSLKNTKQIVITNKEMHFDPSLNTQLTIHGDNVEIAKLLQNQVRRKEASLFLSLWKSHSLTISKSVEDFFDDKEEIFEPSSVLNLEQIFEEAPLPLFVGNSLPIRYVDNFLFPEKISGKIYGNRGVSGIDGNLSTALGICYSLQRPTVAIMGDCTFLHDVAALRLMEKERLPLILVVINNNGGGIYNFLPYKEDKTFIDTIVSPSSDLEIGKIASSYNIPYWRAETSNDYTKMALHQITEQKGAIIEIRTNKEENVTIHKQLDKYIQKHLQKSMKKERHSYFSLPKRKKQNPSFASTDS